MWTLTQRWYGERLAEPYRAKRVEELQGLLTDVGLVSEFWQFAT